MNSSLFRGVHVLALGLAGAGLACAQGGKADLVAPVVRDKVVNDALRVVDSRNQPFTLPTPLPNPFVGKQLDRPEGDQPVVAAPTWRGPDLLARLASRIPSTGTISIGGSPMLLLGQKRLKVGDTYPISFEGQTYEVSIEAVTATTFTIRRGEDTHTRSVHSTTPLASPTTNRP